MDDLTWCGSGKNGSDGINYIECPDSKSCDFATAFWGEASSRVSALKLFFFFLLFFFIFPTNVGMPKKYLFLDETQRKGIMRQRQKLKRTLK